MSRLRSRAQEAGPPGHIVMVDDDQELLDSFRALLERDGHRVDAAASGAEGIALVRRVRPDLILLDYCMPGLTGADVVREVRQFDALVQVILVTGYAAEQPGRRLLSELDIQGYHDKTDGPQRLLVLVDAALKHATMLKQMARQRTLFRTVADAGPELAALRSVGETLWVAIGHARALVGAARGDRGSGAAPALAALEDGAGGATVLGAEGAGGKARGLDELDAETGRAVRRALAMEAPGALDGRHVAIPVALTSGTRGCLLVAVDGVEALDPDVVLACGIYGRQVAQSLESARLYERATHDALTGLHNRDFGDRRLREVLHLAGRSGRQAGVLMMDLDHFKSINDSLGHAAGDQVLRCVAGATVRSCRASDVVARYGGEELLVVLPDTNIAGMSAVAERLRGAIAELAVPFDGRSIRVTVSIGGALAPPGWEDGQALVRAADLALYRAKSGGRDRWELASHVPSTGVDIPADRS